jgi:plastocyanin domain-containing protein
MATNQTKIVVVLLVVGSLVGIFLWKGSNNKTTSGISKTESITQTDGLTVVKLSASRMGVYNPKVIKVKLGTKVRIEGDPLSLSGSMDTVIVDGYDVSKKINEGDNVLEFVADQTGEFSVHCANGMGNATLIVE